jgi:hypothetical protein
MTIRAFMRDHPYPPSSAVEALLASAVDYAGLFPPAKLPMEAAVRNHGSYLLGAHGRALGRFVLPIGRLPEFVDAYSDLHLTEQSGWRLSVLGGTDTAADWAEINSFNARHPSARIVGVEVKPAGATEVKTMAAFPPLMEVWAEIPATGELRPFLEAVAQAGRGAKIRMGGVTADAFPSPDRVVAFFAECIRLKLPAKATAGLHHAVAGSYPLTYEANAASAPMFGYINLILAAALLQGGGPGSSAIRLLTDGSAENFRCEGEAILWRDARFSTEQIAQVRRTLVRSFGSCSFNEPIEGLQSLGWL